MSRSNLSQHTSVKARQVGGIAGSAIESADRINKRRQRESEAVTEPAFDGAPALERPQPWPPAVAHRPVASRAGREGSLPLVVPKRRPGAGQSFENSPRKGRKP
jgi:hypothetical protein